MRLILILVSPVLTYYTCLLVCVIFNNNITDPLTSTTLCGFCDASNKAFAAVVYLLLKTKTCSMVVAISNDPSTRVVICLSSLEARRFSTQYSSTAEDFFGSKVLHRFPGHTILDSWQGQGVETFRPKSSEANTTQHSAGPLAPLLRKNQSS